jgi:hypothetical protein
MCFGRQPRPVRRWSASTSPSGFPAHTPRQRNLFVPEFLDAVGSPPWEEYGVVARRPSEITLRRPFYPYAPAGTRREHLDVTLGSPPMNCGAVAKGRTPRRCSGRSAASQDNHRPNRWIITKLIA